MIKSMTGYGTGAASLEDVSFTVDMKSVNSRYLDINLRLPSTLYPYENELKNIIKKRLTRGKVDVYIKCQSLLIYDTRVEINEALFEEYLRRAEELSVKYNIENNLKLSHFIGNNEIFVLDSDDSEDKRELFLKGALEALEKSLDSFIKAREVEGEELYTDLLSKLDFIDEQVGEIKKYSDIYNKEIGTFYFERVAKLAEDFKLDNDRIYTEVALLIDKSCVDEEVVRLSSHVKQFRDVINSDKAVGKKLDFIVQEMNRESNTILSKSKSLKLSNIGLEIKTEIEKIREQIQNIE